MYEISVTEGGDDDEEEEEKTTLKLVSRLETRSVLRSLGVVRVSGGKRDVIVVGSDSGCLSVVDFEGGVGKVLHCPVFGKVGELYIIMSFALHFSLCFCELWSCVLCIVRACSLDE